MPAYPYIHSWPLAIAAVAVLAIGILLRRFAARHSMTGLIASSARDAAFASLKARKMPEVPGALGAKFTDLRDTQSNVGRAKKVAGYGIRHFLAQAFGIAGLVAIVAGLALGVLSVFWR